MCVWKACVQVHTSAGKGVFILTLLELALMRVFPWFPFFFAFILSSVLCRSFGNIAREGKERARSRRKFVIGKQGKWRDRGEG